MIKYRKNSVIKPIFIPGFKGSRNIFYPLWDGLYNLVLQI